MKRKTSPVSYEKNNNITEKKSFAGFERIQKLTFDLSANLGQFSSIILSLSMDFKLLRHNTRLEDCYNEI